jgi:hypothetical protein
VKVLRVPSTPGQETGYRINWINKGDEKGCIIPDNNLRDIVFVQGCIAVYASGSISDSLSSRQYPYAIFIVEGIVTDSLTQEPIKDLSVLLKWKIR